MTRPSETDAPGCPAASGHVVLRAIVLAGLVVCALLLVAGLPGTFSPAGSGGRLAPTRAVAAVAGCDAVRSAGDAVGALVAEADEVGRRPSFADPLPGAVPRLSGTGFRPREGAVVAVRDRTPPDRPPRHA